MVFGYSLTFGDLARSDQSPLLKNGVSMRDGAKYSYYRTPKGMHRSRIRRQLDLW